MEIILAEEKLVRRIEIVNVVLLVVLPLGAWLLLSPEIALGVFLGAGIVTLSFRVLKWQLDKAFRTPGRLPQKGRVFVAYYLRYVATLFLVFVVIYYGWADPIAFLVGLSVVVMSILVGGGLEVFVSHGKKGDS
ncbi:MAG TPA: ATP synthase subunit I [Syntrophobacteraceae bacterium]|nr:ATP synthase subunit I [Syntrophobacteraceae bacterium]